MTLSDVDGTSGNLGWIPADLPIVEALVPQGELSGLHIL
jgi:hypothetical protein